MIEHIAGLSSVVLLPWSQVELRIPPLSLCLGLSDGQPPLQGSLEAWGGLGGPTPILLAYVLLGLVSQKVIRL